MDTKSKILFFIFFLTIVAVTVLSYERYVVALDYTMRIQTQCDPSNERCFISTCDPSVDSTCPADESQRTTYYKIILKKAYAVPQCDPSDTQCPELSCVGDAECQEIFCDTEVLEEGEACAPLMPEYKHQNGSASPYGI